MTCGVVAFSPQALETKIAVRLCNDVVLSEYKFYNKGDGYHKQRPKSHVEEKKVFPP